MGAKRSLRQRLKDTARKAAEALYIIPGDSKASDLDYKPKPKKAKKVKKATKPVRRKGSPFSLPGALKTVRNRKKEYDNFDLKKYLK